MRASWWAAACFVAGLIPGVAAAGSLKVFPVRLLLTPQESVQTMTIHNDGAESSRIQLRVYAWRQQDGEDVFEPTRDVLANPALFELPPQGQQIARFGLRTKPGAAEKSYRVFLEEVPTDRPTKIGEVQTLLRISIPIFVPAPGAAPRLSWRARPAGPQKMALAIRNDGGEHVQLNRLSLTRRGGGRIGGSDVSVYLLPGTAKQVLLDVSSRADAGQAIKLDAVTDHGPMSVDLVSEAGPGEAARP
ncbi:fimbrial biogenesis chaperone [Phenylobacterium koreense]|uniref:Fimbrial chaperone protein n=1 Tax=Phenylobacterium koreense TaxID=266125 RepID=A0ABV2EGT1_9CAUL